MADYFPGGEPNPAAASGADVAPTTTAADTAMDDEML